MHRHDRLGLRGDRRADLGRVDAVGLRVAVHEHRRRARVRDGRGGGDERVGGDDDFVARPDAQSLQRQEQRLGAVRDADAVLRAAVGRELRLERLHLIAEDERGVVADVLDRRLDFRRRWTGAGSSDR